MLGVNIFAVVAALVTGAAMCYVWLNEGYTREALTNLRVAIHAQKSALVAQQEAVTVSKKAVEIAQQGRLDCAQGLDIVTQRQTWLNKSLGLSARLEAEGKRKE